MSVILLKNISMTLDPASIQKAIDEVNSMSGRLKEALDKVCEWLLAEGVKVAKIRLLRYGVPQGPLYNSIKQVAFDPQKGVGYITAGEGLLAGGISGGAEGKTSKWPLMSYAVFIEFGTGTYKKRAEEKNANPFGPKLKLPPKAEEKGWVYFNEKDNKFYFTRGQPPKPFMTNTFVELMMTAREKGGTMLLEYLPKG